VRCTAGFSYYSMEMPTLRIRKVTRKRKGKPDVVEYVCTFPKEIAEQFRLVDKTFEVLAHDRNHILLKHSMECGIDSKGSQIASNDHGAPEHGQMTLFP